MTGPTIFFDAGNSLQAVLSKLSELPVIDLTVRRPTIEELFMSDYRSVDGEENGQ
ncbi:hypothetical protein [Paenibacillus sp. DMB20]|uniref:hypothetical protein n=1 Tax=Paenibacillus sp. DMB20 TaxID=1642570 RepID=UPI000ACB1333|nr:hypothetical protein [Paenibacillus sp. DMB20]